MDSSPITSNSSSLYRDDHLEIDFNARSVTLDSQRMVLTRKEYELLLHLVQNAGEIIPRQLLLIRVWGFRKGTRTRTLDVHIRNLRKKLGSYGREYIDHLGSRLQVSVAPHPGLARDLIVSGACPDCMMTVAR